MAIHPDFKPPVQRPVQPQNAFTPDANDANKSREVWRLNKLSLLASFAREIRAIRAWNSLHQQTRIRVMGGASARQLQSRCKMYSCFCKSTKMYIQLRVPTYNHNYFVLHCCFGFSASASARIDVTARASSWLVNAASFARIAQQDCLSRLCIDLTCKSFARFASFASGVNAPSSQTLICPPFWSCAESA